MNTPIKLYIVLVASFGLAFWGASEMWRAAFGPAIRSLG